MEFHLDSIVPLSNLEAHNDVIHQVAWSPDGRYLASCSSDITVKIWDIENKRSLTLAYKGIGYDLSWSPNGHLLAVADFFSAVFIFDIEQNKLIKKLVHQGSVHSVCFSPDGEKVISGCNDNKIRIWSVNGDIEKELRGHDGTIFRIVWQPNGTYFASCSSDKTVKIWDGVSGKLIRSLNDHKGSVYAINWTRDGQLLISGSSDNTIRIWNPYTGRNTHILEGHLDSVTGISCSVDNSLVASKSLDGMIRLWNANSWELVGILTEGISQDNKRQKIETYTAIASGLSFNPVESKLASTDEVNNTRIKIWDLYRFVQSLPQRKRNTETYKNAKVVLLGDSGVGKSGLGLVLTGNPFMPTESTHGRRVWILDHQNTTDETQNISEIKETLLWDLAGQPGYRIVHQLHLNEVALALIIFDAKSEIDPFSGVRYWIKALTQADFAANSKIPIKKILVAARIDRGGGAG